MCSQQQRIANLEQQIAKLECDHGTTKIRYRQAINGNKMFKKQCCRCGDLVENWIPHEKVRNKDLVEPINDTLAATYRRNKLDLEEALRQLITQHQKSDFDEWYQQYLSSPEWREKRKRVLDRCGSVCEGCRTTYATIIHHMTYRNVGDEFLFELVGLCQVCHDRYHTEQKEQS